MRRSVKKKSSSSTKRVPKRAASRTPRKPVKKTKKRPAVKSFRKIKPVVVPAAVTSPEPPQNSWVDDRIPQYYGEDKLVLLVRDPWWLFAYWEITPGRQKQLAYEIEKKEGGDRKTVLRVYDLTGGQSLPKFNSFFDIELNFYSDNWYIDTGMPDREWVAEIGYRTASGRFFPLVRSNKVRTPAFGISEVLDEEWMLPEEVYYRLIGRSLSTSASGNSMDIRKLLEKYLKNVVSSENTPEFSKKGL